MKILVASDSFKGSLTSLEVGEICKYKLPNHEVDIIPVSDGGEGLIPALENNLQGSKVKLKIRNSINEIIEGYYLLSKDKQIVVIESAIAVGLGDLSVKDRNPLKTSTYGVGQLIKYAIDSGVNNILIGIGGTSTNDGGSGMLEALGAKFFDENGKEITNMCGEKLSIVHSLDLTKVQKLCKNISIKVACDVDNPLLGKNGATYIYARQKGANDKMIEELEKGMINYSTCISKAIKKDNSTFSGAGAAGGLGYCLAGVLNAKLKQGIDLVLDEINFAGQLDQYDLIITGEGKIDKQTIMGKTISGILNRTKNANKDVIAICGVSEVEKLEGIKDIYSIVPNVTDIETSINNPKKYLKKLIEEKVEAML